MIKVFICLLFTTRIYSSQLAKPKKINLDLHVYNKSLNSFASKAYPAISAIKGDFIIKTFYPESINNPFKFKNLKIYNSADYYELVVSYKGVNYFRKISKEEIINKQEISVYELGNKKNEISIKEIQYLIENDEFNKRVLITQDILIENNANFVYSPLLPQKEFIKIQLPKGVNNIVANSNLNKSNYIIKDGFLILKVFLKPKDNYFSFSYILNVDEYPFLVKTKSMNDISKLTLISLKTNTRIKSNMFSNFTLQETNNMLVKTSIKKNISKFKNINFIVLGKANFSNSFFKSNISIYKLIKAVDKYIIIISFTVFFIALFLILISNKENKCIK